MLGEHFASGIAHDAPSYGSKHPQLETCQEDHWATNKSGHHQSASYGNLRQGCGVVLFHQAPDSLLVQVDTCKAPDHLQPRPTPPEGFPCKPRCSAPPPLQPHCHHRPPSQPLPPPPVSLEVLSHWTPSHQSLSCWSHIAFAPQIVPTLSTGCICSPVWVS